LNRILACDFSAPSFRRSLKKLPNNIYKEAKTTIGTLALLGEDPPPDALRLHPLKSVLVESALNPKKRSRFTHFTLPLTAVIKPALRLRTKPPIFANAERTRRLIEVRKEANRAAPEPTLAGTGH
jgi:hypothetical protein